MVLVQLVDLRHIAFNHILRRAEAEVINHDGLQIAVRRVNINANENEIDLSLYKLNHSSAIQRGFPIENMNNRQFEATLQGNNAYKYFITRGYDVDKRELLQLFHDIPTQADVNSLNLARNYIIYFPHEMLPPNIVHLNLSKNQLKDVPVMAQQLRTVKYSHNPIKAVPEQLPPNLTKLALSHTFVSRLPNLPTTLTSLSLKNTKITTLPDNFHQLVHLDNLKLDYNPQLNITEDTLNFIEEVFERRRARELAAQEAREREAERRRQDAIAAGVAPEPYQVRYGGQPGVRDVYRDGQNVHDTKINKEVMDNVKKLLQKLCKTCKKEFNQTGVNHQTCFNRIYQKFLPDNIVPSFSLIYNLFSTQSSNTSNTSNTKIENYTIINFIMAQPTKFQVIPVKEIFYAYFNYVDSFEPEKQKDILEILDSDLPEMRMVCCTGRVARLINTLSGISDDVGVKISEQAQIQAKHNLVNKKYALVPKLPQTVLRCWLFKKLLEEIKLEEAVVNVWLEPYLDILSEEIPRLKEIRVMNEADPINVSQQDEDEDTEYVIIREQLGGRFEVTNCLNWMIPKAEELAEENND